MWALVNSIRNLGNPDTRIFSTPGTHTAAASRTSNKNLEEPQLHDLERLHDVLAALERVTGVDSLNRQTPLNRRTRAASTIRDLDKNHTIQQIRGLLSNACNAVVAAMFTSFKNRRVKAIILSPS